jgi:hypothetical protein
MQLFVILVLHLRVNDVRSWMAKFSGGAAGDIISCGKALRRLFAPLKASNGGDAS